MATVTITFTDLPDGTTDINFDFGDTKVPQTEAELAANTSQAVELGLVTSQFIGGLIAQSNANRDTAEAMTQEPMIILPGGEVR